MSGNVLVATEPSPDRQHLTLRYVPQPDEIVTWPEYIQRGVEVIELARDCFMVLGQLVEVGWQRYADKQAGKRKFAAKLAAEWGCSRSTITKAWVLHGTQLPLPEDAPPTLAYEVISSTDDPAEQEERLEKAMEEGWTTHDVREVKRLANVWDRWERVRLALRDDGTLLARNGSSDWVRIGRLENGDDDVARAGVELARHRLRV